MTRNDVINEYFEWLFAAVCGGQRHQRSPYRKLITLLHQTNFRWSIDMDSNRAVEGTYLRRTFAKEINYPEAVVDLDGPCSVLEMMVALSIRCEAQIMSDPEIGDRTAQWFWGMVKNLGLYKFTDNRFNKFVCIDILERFMNHDYERNGQNGLFTVPNCQYDLRTVEIWYQMCWFLDTIMGG